MLLEAKKVGGGDFLDPAQLLQLSALGVLHSHVPVPIAPLILVHARDTRLQGDLHTCKLPLCAAVALQLAEVKGKCIEVAL